MRAVFVALVLLSLANTALFVQSASTKAPKTKAPTTTASSTKAPSIISTKAPTTKGTKANAVYGLQDDCHENNPDEFNFCFNLLSDSGEHEDWMEYALDAKEKWEQIIGKDTVDPFKVEDLYSPTPAPFFIPLPSELDSFLSEVNYLVPDEVDDIYVYIKESSTLPSGVLAQAFAERTQRESSISAGDPRDVAYTVSGGIFFSTSLLDGTYPGIDFADVILHELAHVLGFGGEAMENRVGNDGGVLHYTGSEGLAQWYKIGCTGKLPLGGTSGSDRSHWLDECLSSELMTAEADTGENPLSAITLGVLADVGYAINFGKADDFTIANLGTCDADFCTVTSTRKLNPIEQQEGKPPLTTESWNSVYTSARDHGSGEFIFITFLQGEYTYDLRITREEVNDYFISLAEEDGGI
eukprot:Nitzschia sp. Nitz4//scaffold173_size47512//12901//14133//NITZ4_007155-RA/size47512-processed-gene-0.33-mRNA-1//-1//CDS//3329538793//5934//frame0